MKRGSAKSKIVHQSDSQKKLNRPLLRALAKAYRGENDIRFWSCGQVHRQKQVIESVCTTAFKVEQSQSENKKKHRNGRFSSRYLIAGHCIFRNQPFVV